MVKDIIYPKKANKMNLEESETDERDQIENRTKLNMRNVHEPRENENLEDTDIDMEYGPQTIETDLE